MANREDVEGSIFGVFQKLLRGTEKNLGYCSWKLDVKQKC